MQDLLSYLQGVHNWEIFGYFLLPKDKGDLVEVSRYNKLYLANCWQCHEILELKIFFEFKSGVAS